MNQPTNPLDDLAQFDPASLPQPARSPARPPRAHSSGRRELRASIYSRGITIHHQSATNEEVLETQMKGEPPKVTLPIKRADGGERPAGISARQWKKLKREKK